MDPSCRIFILTLICQDDWQLACKALWAFTFLYFLKAPMCLSSFSRHKFLCHCCACSCPDVFPMCSCPHESTWWTIANFMISPSRKGPVRLGNQGHLLELFRTFLFQTYRRLMRDALVSHSQVLGSIFEILASKWQELLLEQSCKGMCKVYFGDMTDQRIDRPMLK